MTVISDMTFLYLDELPDDTGGHRALYDYLTREMGLRVQFCTLQKDRGPARHRANDLLNAYAAKHRLQQAA